MKYIIALSSERKVKESRRNFVVRRKILKLHDKSVKKTISGHKSPINYRAISQKWASVEGYWNVLKRALLEATDRSCGCKKNQLDIKKLGWNDVSNSVSEKRKL